VHTRERRKSQRERERERERESRYGELDSPFGHGSVKEKRKSEMGVRERANVSIHCNHIVVA